MKKWSKVVCILGSLLICAAALNASDVNPNAKLQGISNDGKTPQPNAVTAHRNIGSQQAMLQGPGHAALPEKVKVPATSTGVSRNTQSTVKEFEPTEITRACNPITQDTINIEIKTDNYPSETSWEVYLYPAMTLAGSGGGYTLAGHVYTAEVCVPIGSCVHFVIYDAYGDGICCNYGSGYYKVWHNGVLKANGGSFGSQEWTKCMGTCPPSCFVWACCVGNACIGDVTQSACATAGGTYYSGQTCASYVCPQTCPMDPNNPTHQTMFGQLPETVSWSLNTSGQTSLIDYMVAQPFTNLPHPVVDIHWWGCMFSSGWVPCAGYTNLQFDVIFYGPGATPVDPAVCTYLVTPTVHATGGSIYGSTLLYFSVPTLTPCTDPNGWVAIHSRPNTPNDCYFAWIGATTGSPSYQTEVGSGTWASTGYSEALCLTGTLGQPGACCDDCAATCTVTQPANCPAGSTWLGAGTVCTPNPCPLPYVPECPTNTIWGQASHGCCDGWSSSLSTLQTDAGGATLLNYMVAENFSGVPSAITDVHWWGLSLIWSGGYFPCTPPPGWTFKVNFYLNESGTPGDPNTPDYTYNVIPTVAAMDGCSADRELYYFTATLSPACPMTAGWIMIQAQSPITQTECFFLWFSSSHGDGTSLQDDGTGAWATNTGYDRGVCLTGTPVLGACCYCDGSCDIQLPLDCSALYGTYMGPNTTCTPGLCPQPIIPVCPEESTLYGQPAMSCCDNWTAVNSSSTMGYRAYDNFANVAGNICDLHWWGLSLVWNSGYSVCDPVGMTFEVKFYPDVAGLPDPNHPTCTYSVTPTISLTDTCGGWPLWYFETPLSPCCTISTGWVSIQSVTSTNSCVFMWFTSSYGDASSLQETIGTWPPTTNAYDLGFCLTGVVGHGACCMPDGTCVNNQTANQCFLDGGVYQGDNILCANVQCPQPYIPACPANSIYSQPGARCYEAWNAIRSDLTSNMIAYDNIVGSLPEAVCDVHWWGLSLVWNANWYLCDPVGMVFNIKFYANAAGAPGAVIGNYNVTPAYVVDQTCSGYPVYLWSANLDPCITLPLNAWISIRSTTSTNNCVFWWWTKTLVGVWPGDNMSRQDVGTPPTTTVNDFDLAFCLTPHAGPVICLGDSNCDGLVSWRDIDFFVAAMSGQPAWLAAFAPGTPTCSYWNNDVNIDGVVSWRDIDPFVARMGAVCPP